MYKASFQFHLYCLHCEYLNFCSVHLCALSSLAPLYIGSVQVLREHFGMFFSSCGYIMQRFILTWMKCKLHFECVAYCVLSTKFAKWLWYLQWELYIDSDDNCSMEWLRNLERMCIFTLKLHNELSHKSTWQRIIEIPLSDLHFKIISRKRKHCSW